VAEPVSILIDTAGSGRIGEGALAKLVRESFKLTPQAIMETLNLRRPIYKKTAAYGHFGRELEDFPWEQTDRAEDLRAAADM
jgi:S-adenosylmethionine synthetase